MPIYGIAAAPAAHEDNDDFVEFRAYTNYICYGMLANGLPGEVDNLKQDGYVPVGLWNKMRSRFVDYPALEYLTNEVERYKGFHLVEGGAKDDPSPGNKPLTLWFRLPDGIHRGAILNLMQTCRHLNGGHSGPRAKERQNMRFKNWIDNGIDPDYAWLLGGTLEMEPNGSIRAWPLAGDSSYSLHTSLTINALAEWKVIGKHKPLVDVRPSKTGTKHSLWSYRSGYQGHNTYSTSCMLETYPLEKIRQRTVNAMCLQSDRFVLHAAFMEISQIVGGTQDYINGRREIAEKAIDWFNQQQYVLAEFMKTKHDRYMERKADSYIRTIPLDIPGPQMERPQLGPTKSLDFIHDICDQADAIVDEMVGE